MSGVNNESNISVTITKQNKTYFKKIKYKYQNVAKMGDLKL